MLILKKCAFSFLRKIMKILKKKCVDQKYMLVGMSKKVYKDMVKKINIIASSISTTMCIRCMKSLIYSFYLYKI